MHKRLSVFNMFVQEVCEWVRGVMLVHTAMKIVIRPRDSEKPGGTVLICILKMLETGGQMV